MTLARILLCVCCGDVVEGSDRPYVMLRLRLVGTTASGAAGGDAGPWQRAPIREADAQQRIRVAIEQARLDGRWLHAVLDHGFAHRSCAET